VRFSVRSVAELFKERCPYLVGFLGNSGAFWPRVAENTVSNADLARDIRIGLDIGETNSATFRAEVELALLRLTGELPSPQE
jgi:hypothetical protein